MVLYTCNKDKNTNKERGLKMTDIEKRDLIMTTDALLKSGVDVSRLEDIEVKKMMKKIAANAVCIGLYNFNRYIISNIGDGDFASIKLGWDSVINDFNRCMKIIDKEGENLKDILTPEEITEATNYTIFEQTGENED